MSKRIITNRRALILCSYSIIQLFNRLLSFLSTIKYYLNAIAWLKWYLIVLAIQTATNNDLFMLKHLKNKCKIGTSIFNLHVTALYAQE